MAGSFFRKFAWSALLPALAALALLGAVHAARYRLLLAALGCAIIVALIVAWVASRALARRIRPMRAFAESLGREPSSASLPLPSEDDELASLALALRRAAGDWQALVGQLSLEPARREAILKSMVEGVLAVDGDLRVIFCNESFAALVGARLPLLQRLPLLDLVRDPGLRAMLAQTLESRAPSRQTLQLPAAEGRTFEVQAAPLAERSGALAILHDVTELERLERVRKDFVANVSHELRTPLTAIRGYAEALLEGGLEDAAQRRKFVEIILNHAVRLDHIASDLLILSELESGRAPVEAGPISVRAIVESALRAVELEAAERQVSLVRGRVDDAEAAGSSLRLEQAVVNLLDNAVKFNRPGGAAQIEATLLPGGTAAIAVSDNGPGIPSEDISRIFERFYRVDKARSSEVGGTGLGLSIVKHVAERMGGAIKVESQLGKGAVFTLTFPAKPR